MDAKNLADLYGTPLLAWEQIAAGLDRGLTHAPGTGAPSAGPPPWHVYRFTPTAATALATIEPGGATRWTFGAGT
jgi:hypothetical protein